MNATFPPRTHDHQSERQLQTALSASAVINMIQSKRMVLVSVRSIDEVHGGDVTVESEVGKGSCFTFMLPLTSNVNASSGQKLS